MKFMFVAVRDVKTQAFMQPAAVPSVPQAIRSFNHEVESGGAFAWMKADAELWLVGEMDEESGVVTPRCEKLAGGV